jgi:hypothetical protein
VPGIEAIVTNPPLIAKVATLLKIRHHDRFRTQRPEWTADARDPSIRAHAVYVPRKGEVNAWDNDDFVKTVRAIGRKTLIMPGVWTSRRLMPRRRGLRFMRYRCIRRSERIGVANDARSLRPGWRHPHVANAVLSEIHRTWNRPEAAELAKLYALATPNYGAVIESYQKAQEVAKQAR